MAIRNKTSFIVESGLVPSKEKNNFFLDISKGDVSGHSPVFKFGRSQAINTSESVIWDNTGNYTFLTSAERLSIVSSSINDTSLGTGARTIIVYGLDANLLSINEIITMNGTTPVLTTKSFLRTFRAFVITSGTNDPISGANLGDITISGDTTGTVQAKILQHIGQTLMSVYTVPADKTGYVTGVSFSAGQGKQCLFKAKVRNGNTSEHAFSVKYIMDLYEANFFGTLVSPLLIPGGTDVLITGQTSVGTIDASASFGMILINS